MIALQLCGRETGRRSENDLGAGSIKNRILRPSVLLTTRRHLIGCFGASELTEVCSSSRAALSPFDGVCFPRPGKRLAYRSRGDTPRGRASGWLKEPRCFAVL
jgi:hypothetical protein